jgi:superfamily I DNA/RNA helicase
MVPRNGKYGPFYGCSRFGKGNCRETLPRADFDEVRLKMRRFTSFSWSEYQLNLYDAVEKWDEHRRNLIVWAVAGSGKTTVLEYIACQLPSWWRVVYAVFNKKIQTAALERMPKHVNVRTTHSLGFADVQKYAGHKVEVDEDKVKKIVKRLISDTWEAERHLISTVCSIISKLKNTLMEPTIDSILYVSERWGVELNGSLPRVVDLTQSAMRLSNRDLWTVDFDDMIYLPVKLRMPIRQWDVILGDEVQDWNKAQLQYLQRALKPDGFCLVVGDSNQSIYGFRGADTEAMDRIKAELNAMPMPLSITYRCPKLHVKFINALFPSIPFEAAPNAIEGSIESVSEIQFLDQVAEVDGSMTLCRTNAPLVRPVLALLKRGVKAFIVGRDIGKNLINLVKKFKKEDIAEMLEELMAYEAIEKAKLLKQEKAIAAQMLMDKVDAIIALCDGLKTVTQLADRINQIFDDENGEGRMFSTVHKAKGLEAETVFILEPQLMPHPMAQKDWELQQEDNIAYVAYTRSKNRLVFVGSIPEAYMGDLMWEGAEKGFGEVTHAVAVGVIEVYDPTKREEYIQESKEQDRVDEAEALKEKWAALDREEAKLSSMPWDPDYLEHWPEQLEVAQAAAKEHGVPVELLSQVVVHTPQSILDLRSEIPDETPTAEELAYDWLPDKGEIEMQEIERRMFDDVEDDELYVPPCPF